MLSVQSGIKLLDKWSVKFSQVFFRQTLLSNVSVTGCHIQVYPEGNDPGLCNGMLPNDSTYHRFLYVIQVKQLVACCCSLASQQTGHVRVRIIFQLSTDIHGMALRCLSMLLLLLLLQLIVTVIEPSGPIILLRNHGSRVRIKSHLVMLQFLVRNGFYLILDNHTEDPTLTQSMSTWVKYWVQLMTDVVADPTSAQRVMVDLINEPDHAGLNWTTVHHKLLLHCGTYGKT